MKMAKHTTTNAGFTAVELLITLFVAALFLAAGYTLYDTILGRSSEARRMAQADNIAYDYLRKYEATVGTTCASSTPLNKVAITGDAAQGLANPFVTVQITCPNVDIPRVSKITVRIDYGEGGDAQYVRHDILASEQ
jgi:prepilin-type N-terminal cleavage/methylation domain-containing protein